MNGRCNNNKSTCNDASYNDNNRSSSESFAKKKLLSLNVAIGDRHAIELDFQIFVIYLR